MTLRSYYELTKPGIIAGNAVTAIAGFLLASRGYIDWWLFIAMLAGISFVMAGGCVFNNYIDRGIDAKMERTKQRVLVHEGVSFEVVLTYGTILALLGLFILGCWTNPLTTGIALIGFFVYVVWYGYEKRHSIYGTLVGSIAGAVPPIVGYCAVTDRFDAGAIILFVILCLWQMPHFYAIAIYRLEEYKAADIPVLPVKKGIAATKVQMLLYIIAFVLAVPLLTIYGYTGYTYLVIALLLALIWLGLSISGFWAKDNRRWARRMFFYSLITLMVLCLVIALRLG